MVRSAKGQKSRPLADEALAELLPRFWGELGVELHFSVEKTQLFSSVHHHYFNGVLRVNFPLAVATRRINEAIAQFRAKELPFHWVVEESSQPQQLSDLIKKRGAVEEEGWVLLGHELSDALFHSEVKGLSAQPVAYYDAMVIWAANFAEALSLSFVEAKSYADLFVKRGVKPFRHFVAIFEGSCVGVATIYILSDLAIVHNLAIKPHYRGRGVGRGFACLLMALIKRSGVKRALIYLPEERQGSFREMGFELLKRYRIFY